jgi:hypothetical protein
MRPLYHGYTFTVNDIPGASSTSHFVSGPFTPTGENHHDFTNPSTDAFARRDL